MRARFRDAMNDDFNTPEAVAVLFELANEVNRSRSETAAVLLKSLGGVLGLLADDPAAFLQGRTVGQAWTSPKDRTRCRPLQPSLTRLNPSNGLISARNAARKAKNFAESDRIRDELLAAGIILEDGPAGTTWRRR